MSTGWIFEPPANEKDFRDPSKWHAAMAEVAQGIVVDLVAAVLRKSPGEISDEEYRQVASEIAYVNPEVTPVPGDAQVVNIAPWPAFPRAVERRAPWDLPHDDADPTGKYRAAEHLGDEDFRPGVFVDKYDRVLNLPSRDRQDEYLEWVARRDGDGNITSIVFVAEAYDYFAKLFEHDEQRVVELYKEFTGVSSIRADDLRSDHGIYRRSPVGTTSAVVEPGAFNPRNRFNISPGIVHLTHRANSLSAEVNLAGVSGLARRKADGAVLDGANAEELLCCNEGGNPNRNSDPLISQQAYSQVLRGYRYTLSNPIGLYIAGVDDAGLLLPDNTTAVPREWWHVTRGHDLWDQTKSRVLRLELRPPKGVFVNQLLIGGAPVKYPGQVAELLSVHLFVTRWKRGSESVGPIVRCTATCCRRKGGEHLELSAGTCNAGFDLAFPGLLDGQARRVEKRPPSSPLVQNPLLTR